jgi:hypothetical protein
VCWRSWEPPSPARQARLYARQSFSTAAVFIAPVVLNHEHAIDRDALDRRTASKPGSAAP